jgi:hypothetical protein
MNLYTCRMNPSHPVEWPLANMVAAVSQEQDRLSSFTASAPSPPLFFEPVLRDPFRSDGKNAPMRARASEPSAYASTQYLSHPPLILTSGLCDQVCSPTPPRSYSLPTCRQSPLRESMMLPNFRLRSITPDEIVDDRDEIPPSVHSSTTLTESQNHHMRSSPPIPSGEQNFTGKLPSFSEVYRLAFFSSLHHLIEFLSSSILRGLPNVGMTRLKALMCNASLTMYLGLRASEGVSIHSVTFMSRL